MSVDPYPRVGVVVPYFGRLPEYFELFCHTCRFNPWIDWLIFSDCDRPAYCPGNVKFFKTSLRDIAARASERLGIAVYLPRPYKLCDLKPAYGHMFQEELAQYEFWGHGDIDVIMGRVADAIPPDVFRHFNKIYTQGHFSLYRNSEEMRTLFMQSVPGQDYKAILSDPINHIFDESIAMRRRLRHLKVPYYLDHYVADFDPTHFDFRVSNVGLGNVWPQIFVWENGSLYRISKQQGVVMRDGFAYAHLSKRRFVNPSFAIDGSLTRFAITPRGFCLLPRGIPDESEWGRLNPRRPIHDMILQIKRPWNRWLRSRRERAMRKAWKNQ